jgi:hypothetical protein
MLVRVKVSGGLCKWIPTRVLVSKSGSLKVLGGSLSSGLSASVISFNPPLPTLTLPFLLSVD